MPLSPGTRLGPYEVVAPLGAGGMGEVYRARDPRLGRDVAIKALPLEFSRDPERLARFEREARLLASLSHPNIAGIHGLEEVEGARYLVLELVEGETLADRIARGPLPIDEAIEIAQLIAAGVEAAHENGVVHRDLKPGNVMLTPAGAVKVLDFGLAKSGVAERSGSDPNLSASPTMTYNPTQAGVILGTAAYMSPEQARGRSVDKRTDVWSFGCVLYECLTGRQAFTGDTTSDLVAHILQTEPDWSRLPAATPAHVRALLERCLRKDARTRLRDIGEARILLGAPPEPAAAAPPAARRGLPWWIAGAAMVAVAAVAVFATLRFGSTAPPAPLRKLDLIAKDMVAEWPVAPRLSPDGSRFAYASANRLWVRDLDRLAPREVAELQEPGPFAWSPDSRQLVYGNQRKLWSVPVDGGTPMALCEIPGTGKIVGAAWSESGDIAFSVWRDRMYRVSASGGNPELLVDIDPVTQIDFHCPSWLPNGELLYITHWKSSRDSVGNERHGLTIFDGRKQVWIPGNMGAISEDTPVLTASGRMLYLRSGATPGIWAEPFDLARRRSSGAPTLIAPGAVTLSASADGSLLYVEGSGNNEPRELVWVDRAGREIGPVGKPHVGLNRPRLSPDGRRVAFGVRDGERSDIWVLELASGTETRLTFGAQSSMSPQWLGSSSRLAYIELQPDAMQDRVVSINADGSGGQRQIAPPAYLVSLNSSLLLAPDGQSALRIVDERGHGSLQVGPMLPDGTLGPTKPVFSQVPQPNISDARFSPDGRLIAYQTDNLGQVDVFLTRFPGGEGQWQVGTAGGFRPRWARDTGELFYVAGSGPTNRGLATARVDASQNPPLGAVTMLFASRADDNLDDFDVSADGQRILLTRRAGSTEGSAPHLVLVQNWERELDKKVVPR